MKITELAFVGNSLEGYNKVYLGQVLRPYPLNLCEESMSLGLVRGSIDLVH